MELLKASRGTGRRSLARRPGSARTSPPPRLEALEERCLLSWAYDTIFTSADSPLGHVFVPNSGEASAIALQADRKIVLGGWSPGENDTTFFTLSRVHEDGQLDLTFGLGGTAKQQFYANTSFHVIFAMAIQPTDGAIVVTGIAAPQGGQNFVFAVMRFQSDGQLDMSFGGVDGDDPGKVSIEFTNQQGQPMISSRPQAVAIQDDGKILVAGKADFLAAVGTGEEFAIARLNSDGTLDSSFGVGGRSVFKARDQDEIRDMALLPADGTGQQKILVCGFDRATPAEGYDFAVARLLSDGRPDPSFASDSLYPGIRLIDFGPGRTDGAFGMVLQPNDAKIVVVGLTNYLSEFGDSLGDFALVRLNPEGDLDENFGEGGLTTADLDYYDVAFGVDLQHHGKNANKIVVAGYSLVPGSAFILSGARFHTDGSLEETFVSNFPGSVGHGDQGRGVVVQPWDDKIVVGGFHTTQQVNGFAGIRLCANPRRCNAFPRPDPLPGDGLAVPGIDRRLERTKSQVAPKSDGRAANSATTPSDVEVWFSGPLDKESIAIPMARSRRFASPALPAVDSWSVDAFDIPMPSGLR